MGPEWSGPEWRAPLRPAAVHGHRGRAGPWRESPSRLGQGNFAKVCLTNLVWGKGQTFGKESAGSGGSDARGSIALWSGSPSFGSSPPVKSDTPSPELLAPSVCARGETWPAGDGGRKRPHCLFVCLFWLPVLGGPPVSRPRPRPVVHPPVGPRTSAPPRRPGRPSRTARRQTCARPARRDGLRGPPGRDRGAKGPGRGPEGLPGRLPGRVGRVSPRTPLSSRAPPPTRRDARSADPQRRGRGRGRARCCRR